MDKQIYVYVELDNELFLVGRLWTRFLRNKESASFQYEPSWLQNKDKFSLEPQNFFLLLKKY